MAEIAQGSFRGLPFCTKLTYLTFCKKRENAIITATVSEAREHLSDLLGKVQHGGEDVTIVKHGKPVAVLISAAAYAFYEELENAQLIREIEAEHADPSYDPKDVISAEELFAQMRLEDGVEAAE